VIPLEEEEIDLLYDLLLVRQVVTITIVAWRRVMCPDQPEYLQEAEGFAGEIIANLMAFGRNQVTNKLRDACRFPPKCTIDKQNEDPEETDKLLQRRHDVLGKELSLFYSRPVLVERGLGPWLYGTDGRAFLDCYNNVPVVGHCHPHVVKAISRQISALNTNTRYICRNILDYA